MRLKFLILLVLCFALIFDVAWAAKDRKKNRNKNRHDDPAEEDEGRRGSSGLSVAEDKRKETKDRVMDLAERAEERKERHEKEEESSEEKDKDEKTENKNSTEIVIPSRRFRRHHSVRRHRRQEQSLSRAAEINDGVQTALDTKPAQDHQCGAECQHKRNRRQHTLRKSNELNDGQQTALETKPSQEQFVRVRRAKAKAGKKDIGHRVASHPHTSRRRGSKAGRRRGQNAAAAKAQGKRGKHRTSRHLRALLLGDYESTQYDPEFFFAPKHRQERRNRFSEFHRTKKMARSIAHEELDHKHKNYKKFPQNSDATLVSADAATISDY